MFAWLRRRRRDHLEKRGLPADWVQWFEVLPFIARLSSDERKRLEALVCVFVAEKDFEGCDGLEIRDKIRVVIAAQACLLILNLDHLFYQKVKTILVYPSIFRHRSQQINAGGVIENREHTNLGEAWPNGPIVLAWDHAYQGGRDPDDGQNTVFHEFAHKLDMLDGLTDGIPPLTIAHEADAWRERMNAAALRHKEMTQRGVPLFLDKYGATHPAEFFAVATEMFFERPQDLQKREAEVYDLLKTFYRQDPAARKG